MKVTVLPCQIFVSEVHDQNSATFNSVVFLGLLKSQAVGIFSSCAFRNNFLTQGQESALTSMYLSTLNKEAVGVTEGGRLYRQQLGRLIAGVMKSWAVSLHHHATDVYFYP